VCVYIYRKGKNEIYVLVCGSAQQVAWQGAAPTLRLISVISALPVSPFQYEDMQPGIRYKYKCDKEEDGLIYDDGTS
jgi:hypothetical protein